MMRYCLRELRLLPDEPVELLPLKIAAELSLCASCVTNVRIIRRGLDARKKPRINVIYSVEFDLSDDLPAPSHRRLEQVVPDQPLPQQHLLAPRQLLVVGMGPAGLFAAWRAAHSGFKVTLLERGRPVEQRVRNVQDFWQKGHFDPRSNIQFGEGGAGTFSDGKLTTRLRHPGIALILRTLVDCGAPPDIVIDAKPHIGTDRLRLVLINFRRKLLEKGVDIRYDATLTGIVVNHGRVAAGIVNDCGEVPCDALLLAPGHSARDTYEMLHAKGVALAAKAFAAGLRIEHPVELINRIQFGSNTDKLPAADYALSWNDPATGRGCYSFCMCPGGEVVVASSETGGVVVNGMSKLRRAAPFSNSALVVSVLPHDCVTQDIPPGPLAGMYWQRRLEQSAFIAGGGDYHAPAQNLLTFLESGTGPLHSSCRPGIREADLAALLPAFITHGLRTALPCFERRMRGFISREATLTGVETRTSAPLRIVRDEHGESVSHPGLYPVGEGAGYAGGIMSAALDGLRVVDRLAARFNHGSTTE
ncbi:MAG: hypothetical protein RQ724_08865 [Desulfuromonadales bacterium]|nr:hypothetical protein [Desulfuromonadales bacterium]